MVVLMAIATQSKTFEVECHSTFDTRNALLRDVQRGLLRWPRSLPPWMFYDAHGSHLSNASPTLPEYYPTRTGVRILANFVKRSSIPLGGQRRSAPFDLGAGTASKTGILLAATAHARRRTLHAGGYICRRPRRGLRKYASSLPEVCVSPLVANYVTHPPRLEPLTERRSDCTLVRASATSPEEARTILRNLSGQLRAGDALLLGVRYGERRADSGRRLR